MLDDEGTALHQVFGVREEYNLTTFSRGMGCDVYLATTHFTQDIVPLSILVIAEVTPGVSAGCDLILSTKIYLDIWFSNTTVGQGQNTTVTSDNTDVYDSTDTSDDIDVYNTTDIPADTDVYTNITEGAKLATLNRTLSGTVLRRAYIILLVLSCLIVLLIIILCCVFTFRYSVYIINTNQSIITAVLIPEQYQHPHQDSIGATLDKMIVMGVVTMVVVGVVTMVVVGVVTMVVVGVVTV